MHRRLGSRRGVRIIKRNKSDNVLVKAPLQDCSCEGAFCAHKRHTASACKSCAFLKIKTLYLQYLTLYSQRIKNQETIDIKIKNQELLCFQGIPGWSEWRDLNPRPLGPEPSALPTALHPDKLLPL